jgi:hypothetical protein
MLSPNDGSRIVLLPEDKELIRLAGWTEAEYREFVRMCRHYSGIKPGEPVAIGLDVILLQIGIALVLSAAAYFLTPKPKTQSRGQAAQIRQNTVDGQNIVGQTRFAPKAGFDQLQNVVEMGSIIPLVYARRQTINGIDYGGVRVNTNLLWSQVLSLGGDQMMRGIFIVGEGDDRADSMEIDPEQFAFGNNLLNAYNLAVNDTSRISIYYSNDGGRLTAADHIAGRTPANDPGNFENRGGADVFTVAGANNQQGANFSYAYKPSTQTAIGLFAWIGNGMCFRVNPSLRPATTPSLRAMGDPDRNRVVCNNDLQELVRRDKDQFLFSGQSGVTGGNANLAVGDQVFYRLDSNVSFADDFQRFDTSADAVGSLTATLSANDVNSSVASRQTSFDEAIVLGELYRVGSALAICTQRTDAPFQSAADGPRRDVSATFEVVRAGQMSPPPGTQGEGNATNTSQIFRITRGAFVTEYPCQVLEIGIRSTLGVSISGFTNLIEGGSTYGNIDGQACLGHANAVIRSDATLVTQNFVAGAVSTSEVRYSFFRISYRRAGTNDAFTQLSSLYGARSETGQPSYNFIRFEMPSSQRWEFEIEPVSGWEVRNNIATGTRRVLDSRIQAEQAVTEDGVTVRFQGEAATGGQIRWLQPIEPRLQIDGGSCADPFAQLAEAFVYNEISSTVGGNPEHEIVYINTILPNPDDPDYEDMAIVGMNVRASREFASLAQFSVYVNRGLGGFSDFPSVLRDLLTNDRFGVGEIISAEQIDEQSFIDATAFTTGRNYFFDGALTEPLNLRQWGTERARDFLLDLVIRNGRFSLQPLVEFYTAEPVTALFTAGNILEDTFELTYFDQDQRQAPRVSVRWRQEQTSGIPGNQGLFPVVREITVRAAGVGADAPLEQIDMSDFCTSQDHAIDRAKFECRFRTISTHSVRFTTTTEQAALELGKCFKLGMETLTYDQPTNGYIARDGTITSWPELGDGTYDILTWDGTGNTVATDSITVSAGRASSNFGSVFCLADRTQQTQVYKVQSLAFNEEGNVEVEAIHWPVDEVGVSLLTSGWDDPANWVIEGAL